MPLYEIVTLGDRPTAPTYLPTRRSVRAGEAIELLGRRLDVARTEPLLGRMVIRLYCLDPDRPTGPPAVEG